MHGEDRHSEKLEYVLREHAASNGSDPFGKWYSRFTAAWRALVGDDYRPKERPPMYKRFNRRKSRVRDDIPDEPSGHRPAYLREASRDTPQADGTRDSSSQPKPNQWQAAMPVVPLTISQDNTGSAESQQRALLRRILK